LPKLASNCDPPISALQNTLDYRHKPPCLALAKYFININKVVLKFMWQGEGTRISKNNLKKKTAKLEGSRYLFSRFNIKKARCGGTLGYLVVLRTWEAETGGP
jgi:hypothetical protein